MASLLYRFGALCARRKFTVLAGWFALIAGLLAFAVVGGGSFSNSSSIPGSQAQQTLEEMDRLFPEPLGESAQIVYTVPVGQSFDDPEIARQIDAGLAELAGVPGVAAVDSPADAGQISPDGRTGVANVKFTALEDEVTHATLDAVRDAVDGHVPVGTEVLYGGHGFKENAPPVGPAEGVGLLLAFVVLAITFGSLLAAGLPMASAVFGLVATIGGLLGAASLFSVPDTGLTLSVMLGLAVGIDYALFIVSRHRSQLADGMDVERSIATSIATAGSAVVFAAVTVIVALAGLAVANVPMLTGMGLSAAGAVALAAAFSLGFVPALMAFAGTRLAPRPGSRAARRMRTTDARGERAGGLGARWVRTVTSRPRRTLAGGIALLAVLAIPATQLQLALTDDGSEAKGTSVRLAYDRISEAFGPGANGPLVVLITGDDAAQVRATTDALGQQLQDQPGVAYVSDPDPADGHPAARLVVLPTTGPSDSATTNLVGVLQADVAEIAGEHGTTAVVTGQTAVNIDVAKRLSGAAVPFTIVVVGLSILLLMIAFRSVWIPVKATAGFLLSVGATFGVTVAVFQWGWLAGLVGVSREGPVASFMPTIVMAVLFGLAMDYEVFLVSSMREAYHRNRDAREAILAGARQSSRIVGAAAIIMIGVFASFLTTHDPDIKAIAFALAVGVTIDAFIVRLTLVPAALALLGHRAWWLPGWLDRVLPNVDLEGDQIAQQGAVDIDRPLPAIGPTA